MTLIFAIALLLYFVPSFIAYHRRKKQTGAIFMLNILTGWTLIGWIAALVWAVAED